MNEQDARLWLRGRFGVSRETLLANYVDLLLHEAANQSLISASSIGKIWQRHILDSAQLLGLAPEGSGSWLDVGTGAGLPGLVIAILQDRPVLLVEPRRKRVEFLQRCVDRLGLKAVQIRQAKIAAVQEPESVISARAVAPIARLFAEARQCADDTTVWLLPRGASGREELATVRKSWHGVFHVEQSITDPNSVIVIARQVRPR